ncbi:hypothetical protein PHMEG_00041937 [Phytophthora megakarya]|uniref:Chromo domain-containing protein n=1 Tax=Phytophthora megakarya TaxID=4795 RepID=A0A225UAQ8_9STRA|nr:hypothetical protein PHMEG_00041937 [Phytophthora megakarya]
MILMRLCYPRIVGSQTLPKMNLRWIKRTRTSKRSREYLIKWENYPDSEWIPLAQLNCGALVYEFDQGAKARSRFQAMKAGDDHPGN